MFIEFSFEFKLLFLLVFPISKELERIMKEYFLKDDIGLFHIFRIFLSNEFSFIFLLIFKCKNKSHKNNNIPKSDDEINENNIIDMELQKLQNSSKKNKIKSIIFLLFLSIMNSGAYFFNTFVGYKNIKLSRNTIGIIYEIIIFYILSKVILKEKFYRHHLLSSITICIALIVLFICYFKDLNKGQYSIFNTFWYYLVYYFLYGVFNIFLKKYTKVYLHSIYFIMLIIGAFVCVPMLIYDIVAYFTKPDISGIIIGFKNNITSAKDFFLFFVETIFQFFANLGIFWTIYYFTPFHFIISEFISEIFNYYIKMIQSNEHNIYDFIYNKINIIIFSIVFFINLICSLIFNEVVILKFCNLENYTKKYIHKRASSDASSLFETTEINDQTDSERDILSEKEQNILNEE